MKLKLTLLKNSLIIVFAFGMFAFQIKHSATSKITKVDSFSLTDGKKVYLRNCSGCHGLKGEGDYGPNLCDNYWIHGGHYHNILHIIKQGVQSKGMTSFKHELTHAEVRDVAHYIMLSLNGTNPPNAKKPEGKKHVK